MLFPTETVGAEPAMDEGSFEDAASAFDKICARTREAFCWSKSALTSTYQTVLPANSPPKTVEDLADMFAPGTTTLANFARAQMVGGSETTLILLRATVLRVILRQPWRVARRVLVENRPLQTL